MSASAAKFLGGPGELARLISSFDWSATPLGPIESWPQSLKTATGLLVQSPVPMVMLWGPDGVMIYNDGYSAFAGSRHPGLLGMKVREAWPEVADFNDNVMRVGLAGGTLSYRDQELTLNRTGKPEPGWMNLDYSPVIDESGKPAGVIAIVVETTERVLAERRIAAEQARQRQLLRQMPGFIGVLRGPDYVFEYVNDAYVKISERTEFLGRRFVEVFPDLAGQGYMELLNQVYSTGEAIVMRGMELRLHGSDETQYIDFLFEPIRDDQGAVSGIFIGGYEITEAQRAAEALRASEARLEALVRLADEFRNLENPVDIGFAAARVLGETLGVSRVGYGAIDADADTLHVDRDWNAPGVESLAGVVPLRNYGAFIDNLKRGEFIIIDDVRLDQRTAVAAEALEHRSARAFVNVPVLEQGRLVAVLYVNSAQARDWTPEEAAFIRDAADRTRTAVERARNQEALRASEARLRELNADLERKVIERTQARGLTWQVSPDLLGALNSKGYFETSNPAWKTVLGWSEEEVAAMSIFELLHPDDVERTRLGFNLTQQGQPAIRFPNRYRCKNGDYRWISWVGVPEDGMVYCSGRDITEEKAAEDERDRLWTLSEDMLARADYGGAMSAVNPAWTKVLGYSEHDLLTNPYAEIIHPEDVPATVAALKVMGETGRPTRFENRIRASDGEWKAVDWTVSPEPDGLNFIAIGRDLTADKARERQLLEAQEALRQSQKMEAVGQLTGGIAHDFNNLLAGIAGSLELLEKRLAAGRLNGVDRYIDMAQASTNRAAALTQRLLAFSRRQTLDPKPTDVNRLVAGMEYLVRRTVGPGIEVEVVGAGGLWLTRIDPSQLESALLNLAINARDAMPEGGRITIETANKWLDERAARERELAPGQYVSLCVTDTGTGMTPEVISRAFDPFFTTKPLGQGTGLGLSMIHGFVRQSGGQVRIYSELGKGTTMCLYLPRYIGELETADAPHAANGAEAGDGETVLVIDDEAAIRLLITDVLEEAGYRVLGAADGPQGLGILQSDARIDLLITDVGLPGGFNGRQVADAARIARPNLKVLFITGYAENAVVGNGHLDAGMQVITKPFAMTALGARVRDILES